MSNTPDSNKIWLLKSLLLSSSSPWYFGCIVKVNIWFIFSIWFKNCVLCTVINYTNNFIFTASFFKIIITFFFFCFSFETSFVNCDLAFSCFGLSFVTMLVEWGEPHFFLSFVSFYDRVL